MIHRRSFIVLLGIGLALQVAAPVHGQLLKKDRPQPGLGKEIEGLILEYTATIAAKDKEQNGRIRISGKGIFEPKQKRFVPESEKRIGDVIVEEDRLQLVLNKDSGFEGRAFITKDKDKDQKNDIWKGYFTDKDKVRWKFELRKIED